MPLSPNTIRLIYASSLGKCDSSKGDYLHQRVVGKRFDASEIYVTTFDVLGVSRKLFLHIISDGAIFCVNDVFELRAAVFYNPWGKNFSGVVAISLDRQTPCKWWIWTLSSPSSNQGHYNEVIHPSHLRWERTKDIVMKAFITVSTN